MRPRAAVTNIERAGSARPSVPTSRTAVSWRAVRHGPAAEPARIGHRLSIGRWPVLCQPGPVRVRVQRPLTVLLGAVETSVLAEHVQLP